MNGLWLDRTLNIGIARIANVYAAMFTQGTQKVSSNIWCLSKYPQKSVLSGPKKSGYIHVEMRKEGGLQRVACLASPLLHLQTFLGTATGKWHTWNSAGRIF